MHRINHQKCLTLNDLNNNVVSVKPFNNKIGTFILKVISIDDYFLAGSHTNI